MPNRQLISVANRLYCVYVIEERDSRTVDIELAADMSKLSVDKSPALTVRSANYHHSECH